MKKIIILVTVMVMIIFTGCGKDKAEETKKDRDNAVEEIRVEKIIVEEIQVEEIQVEDIEVEDIEIEDTDTDGVWISDEYLEEKAYNSKKNTTTWENCMKTLWD